MEYPSEEIRALFEEAVEYDHRSDTYNAIKLYKKIAKAAPDWPLPLQRLGSIYKYRGEWKPSLHYNKKTVALESGNKTAWWDLGIAATALKKWRLARNVWSKFGRTPADGWSPQTVAIRIAYEKTFEIMWADTLDPARASIQNIPHPESGRRFRDIVLFDRVVAGYNVVHKKRFPIYKELGLFKRSNYLTFSCTLDSPSPKQLKTLEQLCLDADLGFEVWSNASRSFTPKTSKITPEYYNSEIFPDHSGESILVALAARRERQVIQVLNSWAIISLQSFSDLQCHR